jgi:hypothetical protein
MASNYEGFTVYTRDANGVLAPVGAGVSVAVFDVTANAAAAESPLTTDSDGNVAAGSLAAVAAGTRVRFRVENHSGLAASGTQITT